jgi:hypothetical protein
MAEESLMPRCLNSLQVAWPASCCWVLLQLPQLCHPHATLAGSSQERSANTTTSTRSSSCVTTTSATLLAGLPRCTGAAAAAAPAGFRRTTWEGVAFTAQEQAKLEAVQAALEADRQQEQLCKVLSCAEVDKC